MDSPETTPNQGQGVMVATMQHTQDAPGWIWSPFYGVRWTTVVTWAALFALVSWRTRNPIKGLVVAMSWLSGYEILYQATGSVLHHWSLMTLTFTVTGTTGWLIAAYLWGFRPDGQTLILFVGLWVAWVVAGFESNMPDRIIGGTAIQWSWPDEALNVTTKTLLALALLLGALTRHSSAQRPPLWRFRLGQTVYTLLSNQILKAGR